MKNNIIIGVLAVILTLGFSACGGQEDPPTEPVEPQISELTDEEILQRLEEQRRERQRMEAEQNDRDAETQQRERERERERERAGQREREAEEQPRRAERRASAVENYDRLHTSDGSYSIQIAAHRNEYMANQSADIWKERGYEHTFVRQTGDFDSGDTWYRVFTGRYASYNDAARISAAINDDNPDDYPNTCWPLELPSGR